MISLAISASQSRSSARIISALTRHTCFVTASSLPELYANMLLRFVSYL
jgi:hypothetical protein